MTKTIILLFSCLALLLVLPIAAHALAVKTGNSVYIAEDEVIDGNLYAAGASITVDGAVKGDIFCAGQTINISGKVEGDVICAGQNLNINGEVGGSVRVAGNSVTINGKIEHNAMAAGASVVLGADSSVGWDALLAGANGEVRGKIGRDLQGAGAAFSLSGEIGRDVWLQVGEQVKIKKSDFDLAKSQPSLSIGKEAVINGNINYTSPDNASIAEGATIKGELNHKLPKAGEQLKDWKKFVGVSWVFGVLFSLFSSLVVGLVLVSIWREQIVKLTSKMLEKIGPSIGWGIVFMFLTPIFCLILVFTLIGIPLAVIVMGVWALALYLSKIMAGVLVGRSILEKVWKSRKDSMVWAMIIGVIISWIIFSIPFIGWLLALIAVWWGLGGMWLYFRK